MTAKKGITANYSNYGWIFNVHCFVSMRTGMRNDVVLIVKIDMEEVEY